VGGEQLSRVFYKFLNDNPALVHLAPMVLLDEAIKRNFPCR
jgi:hypothetical protein